MRPIIVSAGQQQEFNAYAFPDAAPGSDNQVILIHTDGTTSYATLTGTAWLSGSGAPDNGNGSDGDRYHDTATNDVYLKASGAWGSPYGNIKGNPGADGSPWIVVSGAPSSTPSVDNTFALDDATGDVYQWTGGLVAGSWSSVLLNLKGPAGDDGDSGVGVPAGGTTGQVLAKASGTDYATEWVDAGSGTSDHGALTGLADDDHTQYGLLAGRSGGQTLKGGTASGESLTMESTSHATKGSIVASDNLVLNKCLLFDEVVDNGNSGTSKTIDWTAGNLQKVTLTGACAFTFTAPSGYAMLTLILTCDGTPNRTITWPGTCKFPEGAWASWRDVASASRVIQFVYDGSNYICATPQSPVLAMVNFNGTGTLAIRKSENVSSVTDHGTGDYSINYTNSPPDVNSTYLITTSQNSSSTTGFCGLFITQANPTTSAVRIYTTNSTGGGLLDCAWVNFAALR